ncbi:zinc-ribbon domain-containing protein [Sphingomonas lutea]|uniref:Zinc-ribbon domain-containing protein n=1 Tax=Sphingomonas lutea TaxID=1045317 RepID=A0A7G9SIJ8_9SPHN|nr:zinc-ribbon domain-containing protein [Sphingomonas lutea]QNN67673.1 zinc-ribbon domain-containing protein [Sphingomonas lutea]
MLLTCPNCGTQYMVKDGAIPPQGRQVRCASCKHSWHQDPEAVEPVAEDGPQEVWPVTPPAEDPPAEQPFAGAPSAEPEPEPEDESLAAATLIEPRSGPEAEERAYEAAMVAEDPATQAPVPTDEAEPAQPAPMPGAPVPEAQPEFAAAATADADPQPAQDWREPPLPEAQDDEFSPFAARDDEFESKRRSPIVKILIVALIVAALAAAFWFLAPAELKARVGLVDAGTSPLALVTTHMDRQKLESGNELLTVTGRVINPTTKEQAVPPLQAQLKSRTGQIVYSWTIAPPARTLPAGASASFNSAEVNVPPGGDELTITLGGPPA